MLNIRCRSPLTGIQDWRHGVLTFPIVRMYYFPQISWAWFLLSQISISYFIVKIEVVEEKKTSIKVSGQEILFGNNKEL